MSGGRRDADEPVIPDRADEDRDHGWGDQDLEDDEERFTRERPPHW